MYEHENPYVLPHAAGQGTTWGIRLRDVIALAVAVKEYGSFGASRFDEAAKKAYDMADAMLKARNAQLEARSYDPE